MATTKLPNTFGYKKMSQAEREELTRGTERAGRISDALKRVVPMDTPVGQRRALLEGRKPAEE